MRRWVRIILGTATAIVTISTLITLQQWIIVPNMGWRSAYVVMLDGLIDWTVWALLTPLIIWVARRAPMFRKGRPQPAILLHALLGTAATAIWTIPIAYITMLFARFGFDGMQPIPYSSAYLYELQGRSFYYSLFYWLVVGIVTARQLATDAQEAAGEAARLESEALAADLQAARVHYDPRGLAHELREAAALAEADPVRAEEHILETAGELQRSLALTSSLVAQRPVHAVSG
ncbi:hypothetical protein P1X14_03990 [Sphingomonas sp. AOB5]|uniref:hypothetical protein n=1 Tax=Sphingomonas sp. AOB5 TaxID=3034017 RepID=UPI0023F78AB0|nr:hypothetical protein [Sphingomonas sp. AOB5]MDF7774397.1 hypothetical protein [Sphingomonas sp. AOB5]